MANYNHVTLLGRLTKDVDQRFLPSGTAFAEISLAVNDRVKKDGEWIDEAGFYNVIVFGKTAENCAQYLSKGSEALIDGRLKFEQWESEGKKRSAVKILANNVQFLGGKKQEQSVGEEISAPF